LEQAIDHYITQHNAHPKPFDPLLAICIILTGVIYFTQVNLAIGLTAKLQPCFKYIIPKYIIPEVFTAHMVQARLPL
jgi:hypothetical protein